MVELLGWIVEVRVTSSTTIGRIPYSTAALFATSLRGWPLKFVAKLRLVDNSREEIIFLAF